MLKDATDKAEGWIDRWSGIVFASPSRDEWSKRSSAFELFIGSQLLAFVAAVAFSLLFFATFNPRELASHLDGPSDNFKYTSALFVAYALLNFLFALASAVVSFIGYRMMRSQASFAAHARVYLDLAAGEPLAAVAITLYWLANGRERTLVALALTAFAIARVWYLVTGYRLLSEVHMLTRRARQISFWVGFFPSVLLLNTLFVVLFWMLLASVVVPWWD